MKTNEREAREDEDI